jgi:hypothetical protein
MTKTAVPYRICTIGFWDQDGFGRSGIQEKKQAESIIGPACSIAMDFSTAPVTALFPGEEPG